MSAKHLIVTRRNFLGSAAFGSLAFTSLSAFAEELDRTTIEAALARAGGVIAQAAAELGLSRQALYRRMEKLSIPRE